MHAGRRVNERTSLTRPLDSPDYVEFASLLRTRKTRIRQFQCCICATLIAVFTMTLIVTVSYSVSHDLVDMAPNLTLPSSRSTMNLSSPLKLGFAPGSGSYTLFSNPSIVSTSKSIFVSDKSTVTPKLTDDEIKEALEAGRLAINERLFADATALMSPLPSPSPESRHRYAVSTCANVGVLALAAVAELAATKKIENSRATLGSPSAFGSYFDGGWEPMGVCKQFTAPACPSSKYRTFDGSCNRPMQWGAAMTPLRRLLPPNYADGVEAPRRALSGAELPSAREVSLKVHKPSPSSNPHFTVMMAVYGQFLDHDITATAISQGINGSSISCCPPSTTSHPECFPVAVSSGDPVFDVARRTCMDFVRSAPAPQCKLGPRQQLNQVTAFIDGSAVYGSDQNVARDLREFSGGRLRMQLTPDNRTLLPASTNRNDGCNRETERLRGRYCFAAGDARANENLHLTTMHLLWARQHNRIVDRLAKVNPSWDDQTLYEEARRIVGAQLQHITYQEFVPIVLGEQETATRGLRPLKSGYRQWTSDPDDQSTDPSIANNFAAAAFRFAHTLLPGLMKVTDDQQGTSSYVELHRMLFNPYSLYAEDGVRSSVTTATRNMIQMTSTHVTSQLTNHLFEDPVGNVSLPCGLDLVSLNIQRGRDHGLPGYSKWREYCGLGLAESFSDLAGHLDQQALQDISSLYESVHDVDLYTGALAELPKAGAIVGPTFSCLIADQFVRLQRGDRFWYEVPGEAHSFSEDQLAELRKTSLARLICDCSDGVTQIQAEVMRAVSPANPMMSCEDIPSPSFDSWRDIKPYNPTLQSSFMPANWTALKNNINDTIRDVVTYINNTRSSPTLNTDWLAFKNYVNDTFSSLKNQISALHPPKPPKNSTLNEQLSPDDTFILRSQAPTNVYQDWITFKGDLVKSLNDSIATMSGGPASATKWTTFKQNIVDQFTDLKDQVTSMKAYLAPKLSTMKKEQEQRALASQNKLTEPMSLKVSTASAAFDWMNFKVDILSNINNTLVDVSSRTPSPGDPQWAIFGIDITNRYSALRGKTDSQKSTTAPTELAAGKPDTSDDWLNYKTDIIKTVNDAVNKIKNDMPPPGDPAAWAAYRDDVMKRFSAFKSTPAPLELATLSSLTENTVPQRGKLGASATGRFSNTELSNLTSDWLEFRDDINDTLTRIIEDMKSKKPTSIDPVAWAAFKDSTMNDFAKLKDEIAGMKAEWLAEIGKPKSNQASLNVQAAFGRAGNGSKFDYTKFIKPVIPSDEWIDFKKQINDTVMNILNAANATDKIDFDKVHEMFNRSFTDIKNEISSLKSLIADTYNNRTAAEWVIFQTQLNSTVNDLRDDLENEDQMTTAELMKTLINAEDKVSNLQPPTNLGSVTPADWIQYAYKMNKTISDTLKSVGGHRTSTLMVKAADPASSSFDKPKRLADWLLVPCLAFYVFIMVPRY
ncbi:Chorion peroxidase [Habropoda laboriosa]|uniref:Chorion peroxidase n=1 Tax=Habropoda laboriosa TaxID=597456 RepID=A0A0L7RJJ3_9HYME|nr:PREDICTED: uncharacterized protein LOC108580021 [Habropoda laboriosa]KOC70968.1 Chorion peroxidase [Habropoda laboriosa]